MTHASIRLQHHRAPAHHAAHAVKTCAHIAFWHICYNPVVRRRIRMTLLHTTFVLCFTDLIGSLWEPIMRNFIALHFAGPTAAVIGTIVEYIHEDT